MAKMTNSLKNIPSQLSLFNHTYPTLYTYHHIYIFFYAQKYRTKQNQ